ncbi:MAG: hypothetical protein GX568_02270 [Candidatus Gastranaerophilales bacterium]|mgnify:CR=1 FL=1|nr:hypothetical protein [Candidatus Gastranaerophilales bacterium]
MSVPKDKLHELINLVPDDDAEQVVFMIENYLEKAKSKDLKKIYLNPITIDGDIVIPSREERNER